MNVRPDGQTIELAIAGRIDASNAPKLEQDLIALQEGQPETLVLDLSEVTYISSSGLRVLLMAHKRQQGHSGHLLLRSVPPRVMHIMILCGFDRVFSFL